MAADLHIHVMTEKITEEHLAEFFCHTMGSKYFDLNKRSNYDGEAWTFISGSPNIHVGEVSWLKAAFTEDPDVYIPGPVAKVSELVGEDLPVIDDSFIASVKEAMTLPNDTGYMLSGVDGIVAFLEQWKGHKVFMVSW